jgi:hypothetical protein
MVVFLFATASSSRSEPTPAAPEADEVLDLTGHVLLPGLVNTHHHFYQTLTRAVPAAQDANLFNWLKTLYPIWARLTPKTSSPLDPDRPGRAGPLGLHDRLRPSLSFPQRFKLDDEIAAARRSDCACRPRAARCPWANRRADFRPTAWWTAKTHPERLPAADREPITTPNPARSCRSCWRPARPSASPAT